LHRHLHAGQSDAPFPKEARRSCARKLPSIVAICVTVTLALMGGGATLAGAASSATQSAPPVWSVSGGTISWSSQSGVTSFTGAISTAPRGAAGRTTTYHNLGNVTSWSPPTEPGQRLYYGVASNGAGGQQWSTSEVAITWPGGSSSGGSTAGSSGGGSTVGSFSGAESMLVGLNEQGWGTAGAQDVASGFRIDRMDVADGESASDFTSRGVKVDMLFSGPYSSGGVSALNASSWAQNAVSTFQSQCGGSASNCPAIEVLNEPGGSWFWGGSAESQTNANAYAKLLQTVYTGFHSKYGANAPQILASYDGGHESDVTWGREVWGNTVGINVNSYVDGVTVHPYGGTSNQTASAQGNRAQVTTAHTATGKPVWVTEVGWPTAVGQASTGDSLQWTQTQQAANTYNFVNWARSAGYVASVMDFNYRDYGTNDFYGVETHGGTKKPGWYALTEAADGQRCTVCG